MIDALQMVTTRRAEAVCGRLDPAAKPDCRGSEFADPGGWGMIRFEGGLLGFVDAPDFGFVEGVNSVTGIEGRAVIDGSAVLVTLRDGASQEWAHTDSSGSGMDRAAAEIVEWLDGEVSFSYDVSEAVRTLEVIAGFHASHAQGSAWVRLPLEGEDREITVRSG